MAETCFQTRYYIGIHSGALSYFTRLSLFFNFEVITLSCGSGAAEGAYSDAPLQPGAWLEA
jgi:hypothetical protein